MFANSTLFKQLILVFQLFPRVFVKLRHIRPSPALQTNQLLVFHFGMQATSKTTAGLANTLGVIGTKVAPHNTSWLNCSLPGLPQIVQLAAQGSASLYTDR